MNLRTITIFATAAYRNFLPNYMKVTAAAFALGGVLWTAKRSWSFRSNQKIVNDSSEVLKKVTEFNRLYAKLRTTDKNGAPVFDRYEASKILAILHSKKLCGTKDPLFLHKQVASLSSADGSVTAARYFHKLTSRATQVSDAQKRWLTNTKKKTTDWIEPKKEVALKFRRSVDCTRDVEDADTAAREFCASLKEAQEAVEKQDSDGETIQTEMAKVAKAYEELSKAVAKNTKQISHDDKTLAINAWFPEDDEVLATLSNPKLAKDYKDAGIIDDEEAIDKAIAGLKKDRLLKGLDENEEGSEAHTAAAEVRKWNQPTSGFYNKLWGGTLIALAFLAANWGVPYYLGPNHRFVRLFKWPA